ncbi:MAG TPA: tetratricopeptide repeat protein [Pyrinomonadaceae bacterium]|jgi:tetratricopeptide (TPR) repeat protein|nr:tetratricopeptide repeat protein [Pyrinomonadaceae bacterium]
MQKLSTRRPGARAALAALFLFALAAAAHAQGTGSILYGDLRVDESKAEGPVPLAYDILLYGQNGSLINRQTVPNGGRFRFMDLQNGWYDLAVEVEGNEVARMRVQVLSNFKTDFKQDISLQWRMRPAGRASSVAADAYKRSSSNQKLFGRAAEAMSLSKYADAVALLQQLVGSDAKDYEAWTELGTAYVSQQDFDGAEKAYQTAADAKPTYAPALLNLGRLRVKLKKFEAAVEVLTKAVALPSPSADANFLLGESYLQLKKGSKAVPYLEEAAKLGRPDAHLRLATLYNAVGLKDRAAAEYEQYLSKKPDSPDRKKLEEYIKENKKK